jgi:ferrous iron transport protein A
MGATIVGESSLGAGRTPEDVLRHHARLSLNALRDGEDSQVTRVAVADEAAKYLRAVGIEEGVRVRVLRRAPFGGPLHVRTSSGAELALDRDLARSIEVAR